MPRRPFKAPPASPERLKIAGRIGRLEGLNPADPRLPGLQRDLRAAKLEDHIHEMVTAWPPLTPQQYDQLSAALRELAPRTVRVRKTAADDAA